MELEHGIVKGVQSASENPRPYLTATLPYCYSTFGVLSFTFLWRILKLNKTCLTPSPNWVPSRAPANPYRLGVFSLTNSLQLLKNEHFNLELYQWKNVHMKGTHMTLSYLFWTMYTCTCRYALMCCTLYVYIYNTCTHTCVHRYIYVIYWPAGVCLRKPLTACNAVFSSM